MGNNEMSTEERIGRLETKIEMIMQTFNEAITRLETKLDKREDSFATKEYMNGELKLRDEKISGLQEALNQIRSDKQNHRNALPAWIGIVPSIAAAIAAIIALYK